jgi:tRNA(Ile)-lysidine synthase
MAGMTPAQDESNDDLRLARGRLRRVMPALGTVGIDATGLARTATRLQRADEALNAAAFDLLAAAVSVSDLAVATISRARLMAAPAEIRLRVLARVVGAIGADDWPPQTDQLEAIDAALGASLPFKRTLGGAVIRATDRSIAVHREAGRTPLPELAVTTASGLWDRRFQFAVAAGDANLTIGPLGADGYAGIRDAVGRQPRSVAITLPAFRREGLLIAVPPLGFVRPGGEGLAASSIVAAARGVGAGSPITADALP